jgi:hypothetical protein
MTAEKTTRAFGWRVYGLGVMALGMVCLAWGTSTLGSRCPRTFPTAPPWPMPPLRSCLSRARPVEWRRTAAWGAAALTAYYTLIVVILMNGRLVLAHYAEFGTYSGVAEQLAIAAGGLIVYAASAKIDAALAARLTRLGQLTFGVCALLFGGAHFFYMNLTVPLVPKWLPPTQEFWAYATGVGHIAAGVAILTGVQARLAAILLTDHVCVLHPAGARADAAGRSRQPLELDRERPESRLDRRCVGRGGLAGVAEAPGRLRGPLAATPQAQRVAHLVVRESACGGQCGADRGFAYPVSVSRLLEFIVRRHRCGRRL